MDGEEGVGKPPGKVDPFSASSPAPDLQPEPQQESAFVKPPVRIKARIVWAQKSPLILLETATLLPSPIRQANISPLKFPPLGEVYNFTLISKSNLCTISPFRPIAMA